LNPTADPTTPCFYYIARHLDWREMHEDGLPSTLACFEMQRDSWHFHHGDNIIER
jgi:hypothetical protein